MLKINECDIKHRYDNHAIHYTLPHTLPNVILHALRLCLYIATTADWADELNIGFDQTLPPVGMESGLRE